jgi:hypothetical protein
MLPERVIAKNDLTRFQSNWSLISRLSIFPAAEAGASDNLQIIHTASSIRFHVLPDACHTAPPY